MTKPLVECIPNFSEARRPEVVQAIVDAICAVPEIALLNHSSDTDHNRTVVTFAGPPAAVEEAAYQGIRKAAELINLDKHTGTHPRIGATDVVPFLPLSGVEMDECVRMAKHLGERVGNELSIPVYLYEEAATSAERVNLENNRRGQYEGLKAEIKTPARKPDFGPAKLGPAGATVIGARQPLIAWNVYLTTDKVEIAKAIARTVRHSSGGFRFVKGLGMLVEGRAQVSMNLTNFRQTPLHLVVETIRREAARYGVGIHHSELIGLLPGEALMQSAAWYLQMDDFDPLQVLENRLYAAQTSSASGPTFLDSLAAGTASPGGGSASAYAGAMGAALVAMVVRLTIGKKKYAAVEDQMNEILNQAERLRRELTTAVDEDAAAFEMIMSSFKLPHETAEQTAARAEAIEAATHKAAQVPLATAEKSVKVLALAERCIALGNLNAISDAASAAAMCRAALTAAASNVRINVNAMAHKTSGETLLTRLSALEDQAGKLEAKARKTMQTRGGISLG